MTPRALLAGAIVFTAGAAAAQPAPTPSPFGRPPAPLHSASPSVAERPRPPSGEVPRSLRGRFGLEVAERLVASPQLDQRLRGIARAAAIGTPEAVALLARAANAEARIDPRAMLDLARALAAFTDQASARTALTSIMTSPTQVTSTSGARAGAGPKDVIDESEQAARWQMARQVAALALAQAPDRQGVEALVAAARGSGAAQGAAAQALLAHPPPQIGALAQGTLTPSVLRLLGELGDLRALDAVRAATRAVDAGTRAAALTALGELRDMRAVEVARGLAADPDLRVRVAAAEALVSLDAPDRGRAVEVLLAQDATALAGARLAERVQHEGVVKALAARAAASSDPILRGTAIAALGRQTSVEAVRALVQLLVDPMLAADIASALARSPCLAALTAIEELATRPATRRLAVRAYVVRALVRRARSEALGRVVSELGTSADVRDRALAAFAGIALGDRPLAAGLADPEPRVRRAAAMAARALGTHAVRATLLARLAVETDTATRVVLAPGLEGGDPDGVVTTRALVDRVEAGAPDAPLAAFALAARGEADPDERDAARVSALLTSRDGIVRAHVARGLGLSATRDAVGKLASAYRHETEPLVRRAVVGALAARARDAAPERVATLRTASRLDPDSTVRAAATRALEGLPPADAALAPMDVAVLRVATPDGEGNLPALSGALVRSDGLAVPVAFDDDGYVLAPGTPPGEARLVLAPRLASYEAPAP